MQSHLRLALSKLAKRLDEIELSWLHTHNPNIPRDFVTVAKHVIDLSESCGLPESTIRGNADRIGKLANCHIHCLLAGPNAMYSKQELDECIDLLKFIDLTYGPALSKL